VAEVYCLATKTVSFRFGWDGAGDKFNLGNRLSHLVTVKMIIFKFLLRLAFLLWFITKEKKTSNSIASEDSW
jgi:hypothetical protein